MRKQSYEMNPAILKMNATWCDLDVVERGVFRDIVDLLWLSDKQYRMPYDSDFISQNVGMKKERVEQVIAKMVVGETPLLNEEFDLGEGGFFLSCPLLREQIMSHQRWVREERHKTLLKNKERDSSLSLVSRINQTKTPTQPHVAYLKPEDRILNGYVGWLPTDRFDTQGQVYYVRDSFLSMLKESYPDEDVEFQVQKIFTWLVKKQYGRKRLSMMNRFIINWLENQAEFRERESDTGIEIEQELDRLLGITNTKAANV